MSLALLAGFIAASAFSFAAHAQTPAAAAAPSAVATDTRAEFKTLLPQAQRLGQSRLTVWGFKIYDAQLWAAPGFNADRYASQPLALELAYLRDFDAVDIAERSIKEMRRSATITDAQARQWRLDMQRVFPDVKAGDRIMGVHRPGVGVSFWVNGQAGGEILDAEFSKLFFGIWLSPKTSEPAMRTALVGGAGS
ncbi:MAG: chalcone isomerase family protein [Polaromonas sp.]|nr:chalcone isomerase family protein [Polaromonas sp.]